MQDILATLMAVLAGGRDLLLELGGLLLSALFLFCHGVLWIISLRVPFGLIGLVLGIGLGMAVHELVRARSASSASAASDRPGPGGGLDRDDGLDEDHLHEGLRHQRF